MVEDWVSTTMYATKRRRRTVKSIKTPAKDPPKSNPSKRHRERLNGELDHLASLLPFEQSVLSKLDKLSILRLAVSYLRTKSYFQAVLPDRYHLDSHHILSRSHLYHDPGFSEGDSILQALYGFLIVVTCDGEVFYASRTVEQYLGFHQSDIIHQSVMELIHSEDREEFKKQLSWNSMLPQDKANYTLHEVMMPENYHYLHRSFTVRFRCLLDNTSGFITLEISGWLRILHGQNNRAEDPQLALFATCCPFGPLSLLDLPSRELTFKSKHKMDFSPISMDNRGKMMFGYSDRDLLVKSGYDLVHPDDLNYFSLGHQELIKTGSSGLIAYRWLTKDFQWIWLQSSCKVIYKNSKPDFVICTHRQLTDDEGQDLFHKRGSEFKLPYPLLDLDICSGFDFPADESSTKLKGTRGKKQKNQMKDFSTKRKKSGCREPINGLNGYGPYQALNGYENGELKPEFLYHYPSQNFGIEPDLLYNRSHGYTSFPGSMYPTPESYRLDMEKHGYSNGYYIDPHRQYQHPVPYPSNSYADLVTPGTKFPYDVAKYGFDTYSLDLAKKVHYSEELSRYENDYRKYGYEYGADRLAPRINGTLEPVDLRSTSMYNGATIANGMESGIPPPPCVPPSPSILRSDLCHGQNFHSRESKVIRSPTNGMQNDGMNSISIPSNSVIKNTTTPRSVHANNRSTSAESLNSPNTNTYQNQMRGNVIQNSSTLWAQCAKSRQAMNNPSPISTPHSDHSGSSPKHKRSVPTVDLTSDQMNGRVGMVSDKPDSNGQINSPVSGVTATSVIHTPISEKHLHNRTCEKQPVVGGIPVPVVKSPWIQQFPTSQYGEYKDWSMSTNDMYAYHQRQPRGIITDSLSQAHKVSIP